MEEWRQFFIHGMNMFSAAIVTCFFVANGIYTLLLFKSLRWIRQHVRGSDHQGLDELRDSTATPPATIIMPACNEEAVIVESVRSVLKTDYPSLEIVVVDDGSTDTTLERLITNFHLVRMDLIYRPRMTTRPVHAFYLNPRVPNLLVIHKENGGKADALNAGMNMCRTPYFCTLDSDCLLERDALLRLIRPIVRSPVNTVVSGGVIRILNGCEVAEGRVVKVGLPATGIERFQVVEYLRTFLFGRTGWNLLRGTLIVSGAFALFHRETVMEAGGFERDTVTEDMDLIVHLHRWAALHKRRINMSFTADPVCWTECPSTVQMLARQRRRWQMGLCQTLWKHSEMHLNGKYGVLGMVSFPFHLYVEGVGSVVEFLGYFMVPISILLGVVPPTLFILLVLVSLAYAGFLSVGAVLLEEFSPRRYPSSRDLMILILFACLENIGYRQLVLYFRFQGVVRFLTGFRRWEKVAHIGAA